MTEPTTLGDLDLAALVSSRICHDVISPVGAIANGLEMLAEEQDEAMREQTMALIRRSASQASAKLQFARLAFGAAGSAGAEIDLSDAERQGPPATLPKNKVKLLLNLVALGVVALPRGGAVGVEIKGEAPAVSFVVSAQGEPARLSEHVTSLLAGANGLTLDAHSIQPYYANRIAAAAGMTVSVETRDKEVELRAV